MDETTVPRHCKTGSLALQAGHYIDKPHSDLGFIPATHPGLPPSTGSPRRSTPSREEKEESMCWEEKPRGVSEARKWIQKPAWCSPPYYC